MPVVTWIVVLVLFSADQAFAYVDPATGGVLTTAALGILAAISLGAKTVFYKIRKFFRRLWGNEENSKSQKNSMNE